MKTKKRKTLNIRKAARFAVVINILQVATMLAAVAVVLFSDKTDSPLVEISILAAGLLIVSWGAVLDIREAVNASRAAEQAAMLEDAYRQLEALNGTLRKQRHDFRNHLQVVFSLMEMREYDDAAQYIESVYRDIQKTGSSLRTAIPAVNALIAAKRADCEARGIRLNLDIRASWQDMPVSGWELCRVLGNLIDNAVDALTEGKSPEPAIDIAIAETPEAYTFEIANNGPPIPPENLEAIFREGFTTKSDGHGSGLGIVKEILESYGGEITVTSDAHRTAFSGTIPK
ncbi:MAG: Spo0B domain-containing protein [Clostridia bacterium]|nr:Spo0B domain-containing protein [Clostridia bacterium]